MPPQPTRLGTLLCVIPDEKKCTIQMAENVLSSPFIYKAEVCLVPSSLANALSCRLGTKSRGQSPQAINLYISLQRVSGRLISTTSISKSVQFKH